MPGAVPRAGDPLVKETVYVSSSLGERDKKSYRHRARGMKSTKTAQHIPLPPYPFPEWLSKASTPPGPAFLPRAAKLYGSDLHTTKVWPSSFRQNALKTKLSHLDRSWGRKPSAWSSWVSRPIRNLRPSLNKVAPCRPLSQGWLLAPPRHSSLGPTFQRELQSLENTGSHAQ